MLLLSWLYCTIWTQRQHNQNTIRNKGKQAI